VPVQYFQSVIAIELAVTGALLWQMRYFEPQDRKQSPTRRAPSTCTRARAGRHAIRV